MALSACMPEPYAAGLSLAVGLQKFVEDLQVALEEEAKGQGKKEALVQATVQQDAKMQGNQMTLLLSPQTNK